MNKISSIDNCTLVVRLGDAAQPLFYFPNPSLDELGPCHVHLDGYVIAPKELFSEEQIAELMKKAHELHPLEPNLELLAKQEQEATERERLRDLGVAFVKED